MFKNEASNTIFNYKGVREELTESPKRKRVLQERCRRIFESPQNVNLLEKNKSTKTLGLGPSKGDAETWNGFDLQSLKGKHRFQEEMELSLETCNVQPLNRKLRKSSRAKTKGTNPKISVENKTILAQNMSFCQLKNAMRQGNLLICFWFVKITQSVRQRAYAN